MFENIVKIPSRVGRGENKLPFVFLSFRHPQRQLIILLNTPNVLESCKQGIFGIQTHRYHHLLQWKHCFILYLPKKY